MKETMTVHKALSELKILNDRIQKETNNLEYLHVNKHSNKKINGVSIEEYVKNTQNAYKSVLTLINRRNAIKRAVTKSNALTTVTINGVNYSVAETIDMKAVGMSHVQQILYNMENAYNASVKACERENGDRLESRADEYMRSMYASTDMKNMSEEVRKVRENFIASQTLELVDPLNVAEQIKYLKDEIDSFMSEVDSALSVSNALTTIEVEYETL